VTLCDAGASIERFAALIPRGPRIWEGLLLGTQGVLIAGPLDVLRVKPGGDLAKYATETVGEHTRQVLHDLPADWSAYREEV